MYSLKEFLNGTRKQIQSVGQRVIQKQALRWDKDQELGKQCKKKKSKCMKTLRETVQHAMNSREQRAMLRKVS